MRQVTQGVVKYVIRNAGDIGIAYLLALVSNNQTPALLLAMKLNVASLPLAAGGVLEYRWWVWYVLAVMWCVQLVHLSGRSLRDAGRIAANGPRAAANRFRGAER